MPAWQEATHLWSKQKQAHTHTVSADRGLFVCHLTCWHLLQVCHHIVQSDAYKAVATLAGFPWSRDRWDSGESKDVAMVENWPSEDRRLHHYDYEVQEKPSGETLLAAMCAQRHLKRLPGLIKTFTFMTNNTLLKQLTLICIYFEVFPLRWPSSARALPHAHVHSVRQPSSWSSKHVFRPT